MSLTWSAVDFSDDTRTVTFCAGHETIEAMWGHAARMELALTLARARPLMVKSLAIDLCASQVATLTVQTFPQTLEVRTQVAFLPRAVTQSYLVQQHHMALAHLALWRRPLHRLRWVCQQPHLRVTQAEESVLRHVCASLEGLKSLPDTMTFGGPLFEV